MDNQPIEMTTVYYSCEGNIGFVSIASEDFKTMNKQQVEDAINELTFNSLPKGKILYRTDGPYTSLQDIRDIRIGEIRSAYMVARQQLNSRYAMGDVEIWLMRYIMADMYLAEKPKDGLENYAPLLEEGAKLTSTNLTKAANMVKNQYLKFCNTGLALEKVYTSTVNSIMLSEEESEIDDLHKSGLQSISETAQ